MKTRSNCVAWLVALGALVSISQAQSSTTFTYQGRLEQNGGPADGNFTFQFSLWSALVGGTQIGSTIAVSVAVNDGVFTRNLDFGADAFDGSPRWLQIVVSGTTLAPRQFIARTPYAMQTRGLFADSTNHVGIGTTAPAARLHVAGAGSEGVLRLTNGAGGGTALVVGDVFGSGIGATFYGITSSALINAHNDGAGRAAAFTRGNVTINNGNVGVGVTQPQFPVHAAAEEDGAIYGFNSSTNSTQWAIKGETLGGAGVYGIGLDSVNQTEGVRGEGLGSGSSGVVGVSLASTGNGRGVFGSSLSASGFDFYAGGPGQNYGAASSIRWKRNITLISQPLEMLSRMHGVYFDWDAHHGGHHDVGMIAEEVGAVLPEIVTYEENGIDAMGMDYSKLTPLLLEALKALRAEKDAEIHEQEAIIARQQTMIGELLRRVEKLERRGGAERRALR